MVNDGDQLFRRHSYSTEKEKKKKNSIKFSLSVKCGAFVAKEGKLDETRIESPMTTLKRLASLLQMLREIVINYMIILYVNFF